MKINGDVTIVTDKRGKVIIGFRDKDAGVIFCTVTLTSANLIAALSGSTNVPCKALKVDNLNIVGKKQEFKTFSFEMPKDNCLLSDVQIAKKEVIKICPEGWEPDSFFNSSDSFFYKIGSVKWARCMIRRWV